MANRDPEDKQPSDVEGTEEVEEGEAADRMGEEPSVGRAEAGTQLPPPDTDPGDQHPSAEEIMALREALTKSTDTIAGLTKQITKLTERHEAEMDEIRAQLPKISRDTKATVEGYFDFDIRANRLIDEAAKSDFERAKEDFSMLSTIFR